MARKIEAKRNGVCVVISATGSIYEITEVRVFLMRHYEQSLHTEYPKTSGQPVVFTVTTRDKPDALKKRIDDYLAKLNFDDDEDGDDYRYEDED
jgi:hypothetical protein